MARGKVKIKRIENSVHRQVSFCKRRAGLLKKAKELSVLCDADIGVLIFSPHGKLFELATAGNMQVLIERYMKSTRGAQIEEDEARLTLASQEEITSLRQEIQLLQKGFGYIYGGAGDCTTMDELQALEKQLEIWIYHIRSMKMQRIFQEIQLLKNKEGMLNVANKYLQGKMLEQNGIFETTPVIAGFPYPLTITNETFKI
ncbi:hypothetical protein NE237_022771 [Protea cynaroides]|uniref:Agamous-like MADS-box protein AGL12 n=1 Tax=Protea cynaroides TaxID=273540 RepID=A0A9Q0HF27_9MAGN|nr:hypothetical protein NE237_022771 [Protea cynaroides]